MLSFRSKKTEKSNFDYQKGIDEVCTFSDGEIPMGYEEEGNTNKRSTWYTVEALVEFQIHFLS